MKTYEERMEAIRGKLKKKQIQRRAMAATAGALCICLVAGFLLPKPSNENNPGADISRSLKPSTGICREMKRWERHLMFSWKEVLAMMLQCL